MIRTVAGLGGFNFGVLLLGLRVPARAGSAAATATQNGNVKGDVMIDDPPRARATVQGRLLPRLDEVVLQGERPNSSPHDANGFWLR